MSEEDRGYILCHSKSEGRPLGQEWFLEQTKDGNINQVHRKGWALTRNRWLAL